MLIKLINYIEPDKLYMSYTDNYSSIFYSIEKISCLIGIDSNTFRKLIFDNDGICYSISSKYKFGYFKKENEIKANEFIDQLNVMIRLTEAEI